SPERKSWLRPWICHHWKGIVRKEKKLLGYQMTRTKFHKSSGPNYKCSCGPTMPHQSHQSSPNVCILAISRMRCCVKNGIKYCKRFLLTSGQLLAKLASQQDF